MSDFTCLSEIRCFYPTNVVIIKMLTAANYCWLYTYQEYSNLLYVDDVS